MQVLRFPAIPVTHFSASKLAVRDSGQSLPHNHPQTGTGSWPQTLIATLKTLSTGLYYETLPEGGPVASALFRRIKSLLDELMKPPEVPGRRALRVSEAQEVLDFMIQTSDFHSSGRPKSRRYLDWLRTMVPEAPEQEQSRLIVP